MVDGQLDAADLRAAAQRLEEVRGRIAAAATAAGRRADEVALIAVSKGQSLEAIAALHAAGQRRFGENRVQELVAKHEAWTGGALDWELIGTLQRNKVRFIAGLVGLVHSVDSNRLLDALERGRRRAQDEQGVEGPLDILLQVNYAGEETKHGFSPEALDAAIAHAGTLGALRLRGLMAMAPFGLDVEAQRRYFARVRRDFERVRAATAQRPYMAAFDQLSMGMSDDYEAAVREGSTCVRVGRALFGGRD